MRKICDNCMDFNSDNNTCEIRYTVSKDKDRTPMKRKPNEKGCDVFMLK